MINSNNYLRQVGIPEEQFTQLLEKLKQEIEEELQSNKMSAPRKVRKNQLVKIQPMQSLNLAA